MIEPASEGTAAPRVLVVDDEASIRFVLTRALEQAGLAVEAVGTLAEARVRVRAGGVDLVLLDVRLPDGSGLDLVPELTAGTEPPHVVVMTARESMDVAVRAMKAGARDFVVKPFDLDRLALLAGQLSRRPKSGAPVPAPLAEGLDRPGRLVGASPEMIEVFKTIGRVARTDVTVLIVGESGTGKELVARAIHDNSGRAEGPFITVNCAAIPRDLIESELFGHERGSFTGAAGRRRGKFELADGGTLFLDEIGELPLPLQAKLLRALQERVVERVGGHEALPVDVRIVAATHRNLARMVAEGAFREDLYYRLEVVPLHLPPLRERTGDAVRLAQAFVSRWGPELTGHPVRLSEAAHPAIASHPWPGNVRELENVVKRALLFCRGGELGPEDLREAMGPAGWPGSAAAAPKPGEPVTDDDVGSFEEGVERRLQALLDRLGDHPPDGLHGLVIGGVERVLLRLVLQRVGGNQLEAARLLGMNRNTLHKRIRDLDIPLPARRRNRRGR